MADDFAVRVHGDDVPALDEGVYCFSCSHNASQLQGGLRQTRIAIRYRRCNLSQTVHSIAPAPQPAAAEQAPPGDPSYLIVERDDDGTWIASDVAAAAIGTGATLPEALAMWSEVAEGALRDLRDVHHSEGPPHLTARMEDALSWLEEALDGGVQDE